MTSDTKEKRRVKRRFDYTSMTECSPSISLLASMIGLTSLLTKSTTCSGLLPIKSFGLSKSSSLSFTAAKTSSFLISSIRLQGFPSFFTAYHACIDSSLIRSWSCCLSPPAFTHSIIIFSVAINGNSSFICFPITLSLTTRFSDTLR